MKTDAATLIQEITDILIENGCSPTEKQVLSLAIYILEREKKVIQTL